MNSRRRVNNNTFKEDGSEKYPFLIHDAADFIEFKQAIANGNQFNNIYHKITKDIDLDGVIIPLSATEQYFGNLDGDFHILRNVKFSIAANWCNVFRDVRSSFKNLGFELMKTGYSVSSGSFGVVGQSATAIFENIYVKGVLDFLTGTRGGGICAFVSGAIFKNCYSDIEIKSGTANFGGICETISTTGIIDSCFSKGDINGSGLYSGICVHGSGTSSSTVKNSIAAMNSINTSQMATLFRICHNAPMMKQNNHALDTMTVKGTIPTTELGATGRNGANATLSMLQLEKFYILTMGWDMTNIWKLDDKTGFPRLKGFKYD